MTIPLNRRLLFKPALVIYNLQASFQCPSDFLDFLKEVMREEVRDFRHSLTPSSSRGHRKWRLPLRQSCSSPLLPSPRDRQRTSRHKASLHYIWPTKAAQKDIIATSKKSWWATLVRDLYFSSRPELDEREQKIPSTWMAEVYRYFKNGDALN